MLAARFPAAAALLGAALACAPPAAADEASWLLVEAPAAAASTVRSRLIEVRGLAAPRGAAAHDLVIAIDISDSALLPSGWDVDGDGPEGGTDPQRAARSSNRPDLAARMREADFDDSVLMAELAAARALLDRLDLRRDRVALVAFSDTAELVAPLGSSRSELDAALAGLRDGFDRWLRGTNFGDAVAVAQRALLADPDAPAPADGRQRSIVFLSDGEPTLPPGGDMPRQHALWSANAAGAAGIRIHAFALGFPRGASASVEVFKEMAATSGGRFARLERAGDAIARLRRTDLAGLAELRVANQTSGWPARALRVHPNGSFDGFVLLGPGQNRLAFLARADDGSIARVYRDVLYDDARPRDAAQAKADRKRTEDMLRELRRRTQETKLWADMERERRARKGELELRVEP